LSQERVTTVSKKGVRGDRLGARPCSLPNEGADPAASISWCGRQAFVPTINDDSGVDWIHNVQARLYASAGVFTEGLNLGEAMIKQ